MDNGSYQNPILFRIPIPKPLPHTPGAYIGIKIKKFFLETLGRKAERQKGRKAERQKGRKAER
jgi:hypothetical protein